MQRAWCVVSLSSAKPRARAALSAGLALLGCWLYAPQPTAQEVYGFPSLPERLSELVEGSDGALYGTTAGGGSQGCGAVFRVTTNGALTTFASFAKTNGASPVGGLVRASDGAFYGATEAGGSHNMGTVYKLTANGVLTTLVDFASWGHPVSGLVQGRDGFLYGNTWAMVFRVSLEGGLTWLAPFDYTYLPLPLVEADDGAFYGINYSGGAAGFGSVFQVMTNGTVSTIASFNFTNGACAFRRLGTRPGRGSLRYGVNGWSLWDPRTRVFLRVGHGVPGDDEWQPDSPVRISGG